MALNLPQRHSTTIYLQPVQCSIWYEITCFFAVTNVSNNLLPHITRILLHFIDELTQEFDFLVLIPDNALV